MDCWLTSKLVELISPAEQVLLTDGRWRNLGKGVCELYIKVYLPIKFHWDMFHTKFKYDNKRAQRALGRSPEEKVKGHSGAIYRGPLMFYTKFQGSSRILQDDWSFNVKLWTPGRGLFWSQGLDLNNFGRGPLDNVICQIWKLGAFKFLSRFLKIAF